MREPKKGRKMMTRTQMILSFPGKSFFNTLIRAIKGNRRISNPPNTIKRIGKVPRAKVIMALILVYYKFRKDQAQIPAPDPTILIKLRR
jgi:hypothetical protein